MASVQFFFDPRGRPTVTAGLVIINLARVVCTSVPTFQDLTKQSKVQARIVMFTNGGSVGLAEWINDGLSSNFLFLYFCGYVFVTTFPK